MRAEDLEDACEVVDRLLEDMAAQEPAERRANTGRLRDALRTWAQLTQQLACRGPVSRTSRGSRTPVYARDLEPEIERLCALCERGDVSARSWGRVGRQFQELLEMSVGLLEDPPGP